MSCRESRHRYSAEATYEDEYLKAAKLPDDWINSVTLYRGEGCDKCGNTGYKGRQGLYEVLDVNASIRKAIMAEASTDELRDVALEEGMLTLRMDGLLKAGRGITTLDEVIKETSTAD